MTGVEVRGLDYSRPRSGRRLEGVDLVARPGELVAVVGASGAGKSTLLACLAGLLRPTGGTGTVGGVDVDAPATARAGRVGYVPQDDALHPELTVRAELAAAARIRGVSPAAAPGRVEQVLHALGLDGVARRRVAELSGGERKRVSVAVELVHAPQVLLLDEATSGLDPLHERDLIDYLRRLAGAGCAVVFTTHSLASLEDVSAVLLLGHGGRPLWFGTPAGAVAAAGTGSFVDLFAADRPLGGDVPVPAAPARPDRSSTPAGHRRVARVELVRRELMRLVADRRTLALVALQAPLLGVLVRLAGGHDGLGEGDFTPNLYARRVLLMLVLCAAWLGSTNSVREIVRDRAVHRRERVAGVRGRDVLATKLAVAWTLGLLEVVVLCTVALAGVPTYGRAPGVGSPFVGVVVACWLCAGAAASVALAISALARSSDQALAVLPLVLVPQLILSGGVLAVRDEPVLRVLSYASSARWGLSSAASATHLRAVESDTVIPHPRDPSEDALARHEDADASWNPGATAFGLDLAAMLLVSLAGTAIAAAGLRRA